MNKRDKARLAAALDALPPQLAYLRKPILHIARQDQALLRCGEVDTAVLEQTVQEHSGLGGSDPIAAAEALHLWLEGQFANGAAWAASLSFVEGFLRGADMFASGDSPTPLPQTPLLGLQRTSLEIPPNMRRKLYAAGIEFSNREVQIIIGELDEQVYRIRLEPYTRPPVPGWPRPPHLREEVDTNYRNGSAVGLRYTARHAESGLILMRSYLVVLSATNLEVSIFSRMKLGSDLDKYETLIGTLKCK